MIPDVDVDVFVVQIPVIRDESSFLSMYSLFVGFTGCRANPWLCRVDVWLPRRFQGLICSKRSSRV